MGELSPWHWLIVAAVFVMLFGAKRLPDAARSVGQSLRIFKHEASKLRDDEETAGTERPAAAVPSPQELPTTPAALSLEDQARRLEEQAAALREAVAVRPEQPNT